MDSGVAAATFTRTLVDEWARGGVTDAVMTPGSRSTPLVLALAAEDRLRLHVHHDERSAAFIALGLGRATSRPALMLTTSGTAAAELHPAVVEASYGRVPLIVCTADRPPELHGVRAPQTIDQTELYGEAVRWFAEPGPAEDSDPGGWRSLAARARAESGGLRPGPVHLNLAFREPLVGEPERLPPVEEPAGSGPQPVAFDSPRPTEVLDGARVVVVVGEGCGDPATVVGAADRARWPLLATHQSGCRGPGAIGHGDPLLRIDGFVEHHRPDAIIRLGAPHASRVLSERLLAQGCPVIAIDPVGGWADPEGTVSHGLKGSPADVLDDFARSVRPAPRPWLDSWRRADEVAETAIDAALGDSLSEPAVARAVVEAVPRGGALVVASSMPVRDVEWFGGPRDDISVIANRGANGIDGVVSTAVGVALSGPPTTALVGDLAFLHDTNALLGLADRPVDLTVVVVDNRGGGIFSFLPQAASMPSAEFERLFATPHDVDLVALSHAHGVPAVRIGGLVSEFEAAYSADRDTTRARVIVVPSDRPANVELHDRLYQAVASAVEGR